MAWDLQVRERAHIWPLGSRTPHCFSTSTGAFGFAVEVDGLSALEVVPVVEALVPGAGVSRMEAVSGAGVPEVVASFFFCFLVGGFMVPAVVLVMSREAVSVSALRFLVCFFSVVLAVAAFLDLDVVGVGSSVVSLVESVVVLSVVD